MTEEAILARLEALQKDLQALQQRYYAVEGAILDCQYWLSIVKQDIVKDNTD